MGRFILLGASNARRGLPAIVHLARRTLAGPVRVLAAIGHGRSYGLRSSVLGRELPSILECGLWDALGETDDAATVAVVTDVGNDILFGARVPEILEWVSRSLDRLSRANARIVLTGLPLESLRRLGRARFLLFRTILFPRSRLSLEETRRSAEELDAGLSRFGERPDTVLLPLPPEWYGFDPIHIRFRQIPGAWASLIGAAPSRPPFSERFGLSLRLAAPQRSSLLGVEKYRPQPALELSDGSSVSLF